MRRRFHLLPLLLVSLTLPLVLCIRPKCRDGTYAECRCDTPAGLKCHDGGCTGDRRKMVCDGKEVESKWSILKVILLSHFCDIWQKIIKSDKI